MIPEGYFVRHFNGRAQSRNAALLDVGQDHALHLLQREGLFDAGLVFKGGTALRKCRAGGQGRFSTDIDLAVADVALAKRVFEALHTAQVDDFRFEIIVNVEDRRGQLHMTSPLGTAQPPGRIDIAYSLPWLEPERLPLVELGIHSRYTFRLDPLPVIRVEELLAEKLARYSRDSLARDLYDLFWFCDKRFDEALVRRLTVLKCWHDHLFDGLGGRPFDPALLLRARPQADFRMEAIGSLMRPVDIVGWERSVRRRYGFMANLDDRERTVARLQLGDAGMVIDMLRELGNTATIEDAVRRIHRRPRDTYV